MASIPKSHQDQRNDPEPEVFEGDVAPVATQDKLDKITNIARDQVRLKKRKAKLEEELEGVSKELEVNKTQLLPAAMTDAAMTSFQLAGGYGVEVEKVVRASIPFGDAKKRAKEPGGEEKYQGALDYMDERAPDLVVHKFELIFSRGEEKMVRKFIRDLNRRKVQLKWEVSRTVHASTLTSWLKKEEKALRSVDETKISVHRVTVAEVIEPKDA